MASDLPTPSELLAVGQQALRVKIDPAGTGAVNLRVGSGNDTFLSAAIALAARNTAHVADRAAARSIHSAKGDDLVVLAADIYGTTPKQANAATGSVYLQRPSGGTTVIPAGSRFAAPPAGSQPSVTFAVIDDVPVASGVLKAAVPVRCAETGVVGNIALSSITKISDPLPDVGWALYVPVGGDPVLSGAAGPDTIAGGDDGEVGDDGAFQARLLKSSFTAATNKGTYVGMRSAVLEVGGIRDVTVISPGDGSILVFCGDVNYALSATLKAAVLTALEGVRAFGNPALVFPYAVVNVQITGSIFMNRAASNYDTQAISRQAVTNVLAYFASGRESPDSYFTDKIGAAMEAAHPEVQSVTLSAPASSIKPLQYASYATLQTINRYTTSSAYIAIAVQGPQQQ